MSYKIIVLIILTLLWAYEMLLHAVQARSVRNPVPENVKDVYDADTYARWRQYHGEKNRLSLLTSTASWIISMLLMGLNVYAAFAGLFPDTLFMRMFAVLLLATVSDLLLIPFNYYDTMRIEEKYGFNRSSKKTFWLDRVKEFVIGLVLNTIMASLLLWIHQACGDLVIVIFAAVMILLMLGISFLLPVFTKIFNKFRPLEEGELRDSLTALLTKHGYTVRAINVMDASRRTTKSNAYIAGFGKMKTIVLYDNLVEAMTPEEICAVFAHELGHGLHKDTLKSAALSSVRMLLLAVLAWLTLRTTGIYPAFGFDCVNYGFAFVLIMSVEFALLSPLSGLIANAFSRRMEYRADRQAVTEGYGEALVSALKKLARENFSNLAPSPLLVKLEYSHPPLNNRIDAIRNVMAEGKHG